MAPKKGSRLPNTPPPGEPEEDLLEEIEEEEESEGGEEEEESEDVDSEVEEKEDDKEKSPSVQSTQVSKNHNLQKRINTLPTTPESDKEEGSEPGEGEEWEETGYPPSPTASDFTIKPISPKEPAPKNSKPAKKRSSENKDYEKDTRSRKKAKSSRVEEKKDKPSVVSAPGAVGRVWSEEDEIAVLQGMLDYQNKKGVDPSNDMVAFHEFVRGKLFADISKIQLYDKVRRFKKKFLANMEKGENGEDPVFSKPREYKAFDLSKKIWGSGTNSNGSDANAKNNSRKAKKGGKTDSIAKESGKKEVAMDYLETDTRDFLSKYPNLSESFDQQSSSFLLAVGVKSSLENILCLIGNVKATELEEKWKKLKEEEAEIVLKKMNLVAEQTKLLLEARKKR